MNVLGETDSLDGWEETPEELFQSAVVKCRMEQIVEEHIKESWVEILILDVIPLQDVSKRFPAVDNGENSTRLIEICENLK